MRLLITPLVLALLLAPAAHAGWVLMATGGPCQSWRSTKWGRVWGCWVRRGQPGATKNSRA